MLTPDTKDWTWVLERPCPECGFDARAFPREEIPALLRRNAAAWPAVLRDDEVRPGRARTSGPRSSTPATCATSAASTPSACA